MKAPFLAWLELMPIADFAGARNWGYDGASLYPPQTSYGGPTGLKTLIDACHHHGLAVVMDVVYNHLGPSGNYLPQFGPYLRNDSGANIWGDSPNLDGEESDERGKDQAKEKDLGHKDAESAEEQD